MVEFPEYAMNERVSRVSDQREGVVHHSYQFPGEPWKYVVDWAGDTRTTVEADELMRRDA
jgi:hypothetical protein